MTPSGIAGRQEIAKQLLEAATSLASFVEGGNGLDQAIEQYCLETDNDLSRAFAGMLAEIASGARRRGAISNMARDLDVPEVTWFVEGLVRADAEGTSVLQVLQAWAE